MHTKIGVLAVTTEIGSGLGEILETLKKGKALESVEIVGGSWGEDG